MKILEHVLVPKEFAFRFGGEGQGSGGNFAWGEFIRADRRLELHFQYSLGIVRYHAGNQSASHESYMRELGVWDECHYPGFSEDPLSGFRELAHDLDMAEDFVSGSAAVLQRAASKEAVAGATRSEELMAGHVGDKQRLDQLRARFRERRYGEVVTLARELKYPYRMTQSERRMVEIALKRTSGS